MDIDSKDTREALVDALTEVNSKLDLTRLCIRKEEEKGGDCQQALIDSWQVDEWLGEQRLQIIKEAIINNRLKNY